MAVGLLHDVLEDTLTTREAMEETFGPEIAHDPNEGFLVVWTSNGSTGSDTSGASIQARRLDASGNPVGSDFQVNSFTTGNQGYSFYEGASIDFDSAGNFVVVWDSDSSPGSDQSGSSIIARRYDSSGSPVGRRRHSRIERRDLRRERRPSD